ncbi:hypothetical protein JS278_02526 [Acidipropionibacterium virtanenii]|uniref:Uncharacterized protein n=1 Tax=Acidipropionibacterium virtanenii TaxID=2057246 RepID=A0A344UWL6_9ACTN|nr:hypothetical protein JS278_02526 [Acidipropionibacterium virtanenii]
MVAFNPVPAAGRVARHQATRWRLALEALVLVVVGALVWAVTRNSFDVGTLLGMLVGWVIVFVVLFSIQNLRLRSARKALLSIDEGTALRVDPLGVAVRRSQRDAGSRTSFADVGAHPLAPELDLVGWNDVTQLAVLGTSMGAGPVLRLEDAAGHRWEVPVSWLDALPGTVDSAARAWSGGRRGLDVSGLDRPF